MKNKNTHIYLFICITLISFVACHNPSSKPIEFNLFKGDANKKWLHFDDADWKDDWKKDNIVVIHFLAEPPSLHPTNGASEPRQMIFQYTQKFLIRQDMQSGQPIADLATALPTITNHDLNFTFELRPEAKWDDGSSINANDVAFTFKINKCKLTNNNEYKSSLANIKNIVLDPSNPKKFTIEMKNTYVQNLTMFTDYAIMQQSFFDKENIVNKYSIPELEDTTLQILKDEKVVNWFNNFNSVVYTKNVENLVGAGPYKVTAWDADQKIELSKKPNYWAASSNKEFETAYPDKIICKIIKDANSQLLEIKAQNIDVSYLLSFKNLMNLKEDSVFNTNYNAHLIATYNYSYLGMNMQPNEMHRNPVFADAATRKAMAYLTPVDNIYTLLLKGYYSRTNSMVSPLKEEYNTNLPTIQFDEKIGKEMLTKDGWADSDNDGILDKMVNGKKIKFEFDLNYINLPDWKDLATLFAEAYRKNGMLVNLVPQDFKMWIEKNKSHDFDMTLGSVGGVSGPDDFSQMFSTNAWKMHGSNITGFGNVETDALIDSTRFVLNFERRKKHIFKFQEVVLAEQPYIYLNIGARRMLIHKRFANNNMFIEKPGVALNNLKLLK